jgi:hypothetical protein
MTLQDNINQLIGKPIDLTILNSKLFPFGPIERDTNLRLQEHSKGFYMVMIGETCVFIFDTNKVNSYKLEMLDDEVSVIQWNDIRIVSLNNI